MKVIIIIILFFCYNTKNTESTDIEYCLTPTNQLGKCIFLRECETFYQQIYNLNENVLTIEEKINIRNSWCKIENREYKICCPISIFNHSNLNLLPIDCGVKLKDPIDPPLLMSNSNETIPFEYPWMAIIQYETVNRVKPLCGGTIFHKRYVLTAAHCITNLGKGINISSVILGEHNIKEEIDCNFDFCDIPIEVPIENVIPHPEFVYNNFTNDIGLIRLIHDINFLSGSIQPICLPTNLNLLNMNLEYVTVSGWGLTENGITSDYLRKGDLNIIENNICQENYINRIQITKQHMCAGGVESESCQGDSGGPAIFLIQPTDTFVQFGIVSVGQLSCGNFARKPAIFTRIAPYMPWILETIHN